MKASADTPVSGLRNLRNLPQFGESWLFIAPVFPVKYKTHFGTRSVFKFH